MSWIERLEQPAIEHVEQIDLDALERGQRHLLSLRLIEDAVSQPIALPVLVAHGRDPGPIVGITAALHGNELNGIPTIHLLMQRIDPQALTGTVLAVAIANVPGYLAKQRTHPAGGDLNRLMPGKDGGNEEEVYAHRLMDRVIRKVDYLFDLHTASAGRANSFYVRADLDDEATARMARLVGAQIIVHNRPGDGTLRGAAAQLGIPAITLELGSPNVFSQGLIRHSRIGVRDCLEDLGMLESDTETADHNAVECRRSYWLYTDTGGLLEVLPRVSDRIAAGELVATLADPWGRIIRRYHAREPGIVIGKSVHPVAATGARIIHLGLPAGSASG